MGARRNISNQEFVSAWLNEANETMKDVADFLQISYPSVTTRAKKLVELGVNLPKKASRKSLTPTQLEVAQLNSLIKKLSKQ